MSYSQRVTEANRRLPVYLAAIQSMEKFLKNIERSSLKPEIVIRAGHEDVRFVKKLPEEALLLKFARLVSLNNVLFLLVSKGFVQEQGIIQRAIEETNEDILFISVNLTQSETSDKFESFLEEFWKEDYSDPDDPVGSRIPRAFRRKGISSYLHRALGQPDPSTADGVARTIFEMYSGFIHGAAPQITELYDYENETFLVRGLPHTNRCIDYIFDAQNSIYRSLFSSAAIAKAFGSEELLEVANKAIISFADAIGLDKLEKASK